MSLVYRLDFDTRLPRHWSYSGVDPEDWTRAYYYAKENGCWEDPRGQGFMCG